MLLNEKKKSINSENESSLISDIKKLPQHYDIDWLYNTIALIIQIGDERKLKSEYKYHRDGDIHIVHVPDPNSYQINPITKQFYKYSDWLILFEIVETKKFKNYYFVRTGTHEYLNIKQDD